MFCIRLTRVWLFGFIALIFLMPVAIGSLQLLNEPVLIVSLLLSSLLLWINYPLFPRFPFVVVIAGGVFSVAFLLVLIVYLPKSFLIKDLVECFKPLIYSVIFASGFHLSAQYSQESVIKFILVAGVCSVAFSYLVFVPQAYPLVDMYKARQSTDANTFHFFRFSGTLGFPGGFGYWLVLVLQVALLQLYRKKIRLLKFFVLYAFLLSGLVLSGSRGAFAIYLAVNLATIFFLPRNRISWVSALILLSGVFGFVIFLLASEVEMQAIMHFQRVLEDPTGGTFAHRAGELERVYQSLADGYVLGNGPNNFYIKEMYGPIESVYYFYGYKFGFIGLLYYFLWVALAAYILIKLFLTGRKLNFAFFFCLWALANMLIAGVSNSITEEYKSFFMFFLLLGFVSGCFHCGLLKK